MKPNGTSGGAAERTGLSLAVVVTSTARPDLVADMAAALAAQTRAADAIVYAVADDADLPPDLADRGESICLFARGGLARRRNRALALLGGEHDLVVFLADDFVPAPSSLAGIERFFLTHPDVCAASGPVIADGAAAGGLSLERAQAMLAAHPFIEEAPNCIVAPIRRVDDTNFACRSAALGKAPFDERIGIWSSRDDIALAKRLSGAGRLVKTFAWSGVCRGLADRSCHALGYAEVSNVAHLRRDARLSALGAASLTLRRICRNLLLLGKPVAGIDRRARVRGNWAALADLVRGGNRRHRARRAATAYRLTDDPS